MTYLSRVAAPRGGPDRTERLLARIRRGYAHLLPEPAAARFFEVDSPADLWSWFPAATRLQWLGHTLAPGRKVDGPRPLGAPDDGLRPRPSSADLDLDADAGDDADGDLDADEEPDGRARGWGAEEDAALDALVAPSEGCRTVDGVWDFRTQFALLYVSSPGHGALENGCMARDTFEAVLGGADADVAGFERWLTAEARRRAGRGRRVVGLCGTDDLTDVRVDPDGVVLPEGLLPELLADLDLFFGGRQWYAEHRVPWRRGLLLYGPPGNGKTTVARALASRALDLGGAAFAFTPARHEDRHVRDAFRRASAVAPAVLVMEDVDALRGSGITRAIFLSLLEDPARAQGVFLIATTNYPEEVDPALAGRAGRFDRAVHIGSPDAGLRRRFLDRLWSGGPAAGWVDAAAEATTGLSLAALNEVHYGVMMRLRDGRPVDGSALAHIAEGLRRVETAKGSGNWGRDGVGFRARV